jgi:hypothetical protein
MNIQQIPANTSTKNKEITIILTYLNKYDKFIPYISNFITDSTNIYFENIISNISSPDEYSTFINVFIYNIYKNLNSDKYSDFFEDKIDKIKDYFFLINTLSLYILDLLQKYINKEFNDKLPKDKDINILFNNIKLSGINNLLFLFNLLLTNDEELLKIYISYIYKISLDYKSTSTKLQEYAYITSKTKKFKSLDDLSYNGLIDEFKYKNEIAYLEKLNNINILDNDENKKNIFNILNINIIYSYTATKVYNKSLLLTDDTDKNNIYEILKTYLNILNPSKEKIKEDINIYLTLSKYLNTIINE